MPPVMKFQRKNGGMPKGKFAIKKGVVKRLLKILFTNYKALLVSISICIVVSAVSGSIASPFLAEIYSAIANAGETGAGAAWNSILGYLAVLGCILVLGLIATFLMGQIGAVLTQKFLADMRNEVFKKMQKLPVKYFDTNTHGDIMSIYTNDIDALRQLISQSLPQICNTIITLITLTFSMLYISSLIFGIVLLGVFSILFVTKTIGSKSAKFFMAQQMSVGKLEGHIEEMMHGQKVVKVFCHEEAALKEFDKVNEDLCNVSYKANAFSNMLMPIIHNIGNVLCVVVAFVGCAIAVSGGINVGFQNLFETGNFVGAMTFPIVFSLLGASRHFANSMGQVSGQINSVIMAMAGASRVFDLLDQEPEEDNGYVTLVNAEIDENGNIRESDKRTGKWAWKHPHSADGSITYTELKGYSFGPRRVWLH